MGTSSLSLPGMEKRKQIPSGHKHRWRRSSAVVAAAGMLMTAAIMIVNPGTALAYNHPCGTQGTGNSWGVNKGAGNEVNATHFTKKPPGCNDFNLILYETDTGANDSLEGLYYNGSTWIAGSMGFRSGLPDATNGDLVLLTNVATGTVMKVWSGGQDFIVVDY